MAVGALGRCPPERAWMGVMVEPMPWLGGLGCWILTAVLFPQVSVPPAPGAEGPGAAMTTGDCCHLPGSLCDCPGSAALAKSVEDSDIGRPQYVTQVTAKDGRLLSTVIKALGTQR